MNMPNNTDLKALWNRQASPVPDSKEIYARANSYKKNQTITLVRMNVLLILTSVFIIWVVWTAKPQMLSTKIGTVMVIMAMVIHLAVYNRIIPLLKKVNDHTNINEYLQNLLKLKAKQRFLQTTMTNLYYVLLSSGMFLYMMEYTGRMKSAWSIVTYGLTFSWIVFSWFYFRRRAIKKHEQAINELIEKFEGLEKQLRSEP